MSLKSVLRHYAGNVWREMTLHHQYPNAYRRFAAQTDVKRNKIVFLEVREDHVTDSFALLYEQLRKSGKWDVHTVFIQEGMKGRRQPEPDRNPHTGSGATDRKRGRLFDGRKICRKAYLFRKC